MNVWGDYDMTNENTDDANKARRTLVVLSCTKQYLDFLLMSRIQDFVNINSVTEIVLPTVLRQQNSVYCAGQHGLDIKSRVMPGVNRHV